MCVSVCAPNVQLIFELSIIKLQGSGEGVPPVDLFLVFALFLFFLYVLCVCPHCTTTFRVSIMKLQSSGEGVLSIDLFLVFAFCLFLIDKVLKVILRVRQAVK